MKTPRRTLRTSDLARAVGVHPNTVRNYEAWGYLPPAPRSASGYRLYTEAHLDYMRLGWTILQYPYPGGKGPVIELVRRAIGGDLGGALEGAYRYLARVRAEIAEVEAAAAFLERWAAGAAADATGRPLRIGEAAALLGLSVDVLRNWERDGLLRAPRDPVSKYRLYRAAEIGRLRVIRMLRSAGHSIMSILRLLRHLDGGEMGDLRDVLDSPPPDDDIQSLADRWLSTLRTQEGRALSAIEQLNALMAKRAAAER